MGFASSPEAPSLGGLLWALQAPPVPSRGTCWWTRPGLSSEPVIRQCLFLCFFTQTPVSEAAFPLHLELRSGPVLVSPEGPSAPCVRPCPGRGRGRAQEERLCCGGAGGFLMDPSCPRLPPACPRPERGKRVRAVCSFLPLSGPPAGAREWIFQASS